MKKLFILLVVLSVMSACGSGGNINGSDSGYSNSDLAIDIDSGGTLNDSSVASMDPYWECYNSAGNVMVILTGENRGHYGINNGFTCTYKMGFLRFLYYP